MVVATSSTQTSCSHNDLINDLKKEIQKVASTLNNPIQQAVYQCLEGWIPDEKVRQIRLVCEEEEVKQTGLAFDGEVKKTGLAFEEEFKQTASAFDRVKLEPDIETEGFTSNTENVPQGSNLRSGLSLDKKPTRSCSRGLSKITTSKTKTLFGTIYLRSKVYEDFGVPRYETFYMFHPANWLVSLGMKSSFDVMISRSTQGWKNNLSSRTFRAVPEDALIIQFCTDGNIEGVKTLLARVDASVMDRSPGGYTLLHVSIIFFVFSSYSVSSRHQLFTLLQYRFEFRTFRNEKE